MNEGQLFENVWEILSRIKEICGSEEIMESAISLSDEKFREFRKERGKLIETIVDIVKSQEKAFDSSVFWEKVSDKDFWRDIEKVVQKRTDSYLNVIPYRNLDKESRLQLIKKGFDTLYIQRENREFLIKEVETPEKADAIHEVLMECEYAIVSTCMSKRRFKDFVKSASGIENEELEYLWRIYDKNFEIVQRMVESKRYIALKNDIRKVEEQIGKLAEGMEDLQESMTDMEGMLSYILDKDEMKEW